MPIPGGLFLETFYPVTITVSDDGMGGFINTETIGTAFRGRLSSVYSGEKMQDNRLTLISSHKLFCNYMSIDESSRIKNSASTRVFEITGIINPSDMNHHLELYLKEIQTNP